MKLVILSDTHDNMDAIARIVEACNANQVDAVLHCGDFCSPFVARAFSKLREGTIFHGVFGNNDGDLLHLMHMFSKIGDIKENHRVVELGGHTILMLHGHAITETMITAIAASGTHDIVAYGHYHHLRNEQVGSTLVLNPGEACGYLTGTGTFMLVILENGRINVAVKHV